MVLVLKKREGGQQERSEKTNQSEKNRRIRRIETTNAAAFVALLRKLILVSRTLSHHGSARSTHARTSSKSSGWRAECVASTTFLSAAATSDAEKPSWTTEQACLWMLRSNLCKLEARATIGKELKN